MKLVIEVADLGTDKTPNGRFNGLITDGNNEIGLYKYLGATSTDYPTARVARLERIYKRFREVYDELYPSSAPKPDKASTSR